ncbi:MAG: hypothetical protein K8L99_27450 [Anaerolineae bacterium]|nr:hypothetical protein [Anaerolineae bacterium]
MPIADMHFENGIFFAREVGVVNSDDARLWSEALYNCSRSSHQPIVVLVDALKATTISAEARRIFARASETPNVRIAAVATNNIRVTQQSRIAALLGTIRNSHETHFFTTLEEAEQFARSYLSSAAYSG